ncbi:hypothetical protein E2C01_099118 [Portunus trituberculatus]|uniref:Uncharacterized protein n=1 Tax=Portunus trituberculatus TaxID=210409 RepID=A0A5B7KE18_PORTR|nr:hypothetical protein [Portunus trituberculatus]
MPNIQHIIGSLVIPNVLIDASVSKHKLCIEIKLEKETKSSSQPRSTTAPLHLITATTPHHTNLTLFYEASPVTTFDLTGLRESQHTLLSLARLSFPVSAEINNKQEPTQALTSSFREGNT